MEADRESWGREPGCIFNFKDNVTEEVTCKKATGRSSVLRGISTGSLRQGCVWRVRRPGGPLRGRSKGREGSRDEVGKEWGRGSWRALSASRRTSASPVLLCLTLERYVARIALFSVLQNSGTYQRGRR